MLPRQRRCRIQRALPRQTIKKMQLQLQTQISLSITDGVSFNAAPNSGCEHHTSPDSCGFVVWGAAQMKPRLHILVAQRDVDLHIGFILFCSNRLLPLLLAFHKIRIDLSTPERTGSVSRHVVFFGRCPGIHVRRCGPSRGSFADGASQRDGGRLPASCGNAATVSFCGEPAR